MRARWIIAAGVLQGVALAYMAGEREWILRTGRVVHLRTAPVDPRDPFRGDYVTLDYEISRVPTNRLRDALVRKPTDKPVPDGSRVYATLRSAGDLALLVSLSDKRPPDGLFIRGRTANRWNRGSMTVRYGIEAYFVEQGRGRELERVRFQGPVQVPLEMEVALGRNGIGVLKGYRWSRLGVGIETETVTTNEMDRLRGTRLIVAATLVLQNASDAELAIVDLPNHGSLALEPDTIRSWDETRWTWVGEGRQQPVAPTDADVHVLKPGEAYRIRVDLKDPGWFVQLAGKETRTISGLTDWNARFRLIYRPPEAEACRGLSAADRIWHGELPSRVFTGGGQVD